MALIQHSTNKLYRGVSTQAETNQLEGQVRQSVNMIHSIEKGISRRNPTVLIKELTFAESTSEKVFIHSYDRGDGIEKYMMVFGDGYVRVFDINGNEKTVTYLGGAHLALQTTSLPSISFKCLTVGDTTFVVNMTKTVRMSNTVDGVTDSHLNNPFYWVKRSFDNGAGQGYSYTLDGQTVNSVKSTDACDSLVTALGSTNYARYGSIVIRKNKPTSFVWSDSFGSQASEGFWGVSQKIEDLPNTMSGAEDVYPIVIEIQGDPNNKFSNYWVEYTNGSWRETRKAGMKNTIDKTTMPFKIVRTSSGNFEVSYIDWEVREKGDEDTAPNPSFVDKSISDIFFFKNRLCFLSGENVIMSETGSYYNFYPTTVNDVLPSDPIDVAVDSNSVTILKHAIPFNNSVVLFSNGSQFNLKADSVLAPNDVAVTNSNNYSMDTLVSPVSIGSSIFFTSNNLKGSSLREYFVDTNSSSDIAVEVSGHIEGYLPNNIHRLIGSTNKDVVMLHSPDEPSTIYVYKYFNSGSERLQSAWFKWVFNGRILGMFIMDEYLYLLRINNSGGIKKWVMEKIDYTNNSSITSFIDSYNVPYTSFVELAEVVLQDNTGKLLVNNKAPLLYRTFKLTSSDDSKYKIKVNYLGKERVAENYSVVDSKILVQGKSKDISLFIESVDDNPLEFHTYTTELNYNTRSKII